jgi:CheY-like chemotaxis protein
MCLPVRRKRANEPIEAILPEDMKRAANDKFVLVVDDDPDIRETLEMVLANSGHRVASAGDGVEALAQLKEGRRPCVILLDLMMPGMNGFELHEALSAEPSYATIPIVVITGAGADVEQLATTFTSEILRKPFDLTTVLKVVNRHCPPLS